MSWLTAIRDRLRSHTSRRTRHAVDGLAYRGQPLLDYARTPDPMWQADLDRVSAKGAHLSRLWLAWVPGDPWQPIHRWFVFQLQPWAYVPADIKRELEGPHPRTHARLVYGKRVIDGRVQDRPVIVGGPCRLIDRLQWVLHRQVREATGEQTFARYFWVVQGEHGGHPYQIGLEEQKLRREQGLPPDVPMAGDLPYAPFDGRVIAALQRYDLWRYAIGASADLVTAPARAQIARMNAAERDAHRLLWQRYGALTEELADGLAHAARQDGLHYHRVGPVGAKPTPVDLDALEDAFVNDVTFEEVA